MRILEVCFSHSLGGLELYLIKISNYLMDRGHEVYIIAPPESEIQRRLTKYHLKSIPLRPRFRYLDLNIARKIGKFVREKNIDIIHAHQSSDLSTLVLSKKFAGRAALIFTQQMESSRKKKDFFHHWIYNNLDGLIVITERIKGQVSRNTHLPPDRLFHLYYGIDLKVFSPNFPQRERARKQFGIFPDDICIGIVGRLEEGKGQHILLYALDQLKEVLPKIKVMIIGTETVGKSGFFSDLKNLVKDLNLSEQVIFTGFQENVQSVSAALDVVVMASRKETFGLSLIECMAQEIVPIATDAGGVPEIVKHGENGILVAPFDIPALSDAIRMMVLDEPLRRKLAYAARQTVLEKFNLSDHLLGLEEIFRGCIKR
jgi:glycosyltransferase involved in cell wall biosynthesis